MKKIIETLIQLKELDLSTRSDLLKRGELFNNYHPEMESVHIKNSEQLELFIAKIGWPTEKLVGKDASDAAWLILQHSISRPVFQKKCLLLLLTEAEKGTVNKQQVAFLQDRIDVFEGRLQTYGTQFDWDEHGKLKPNPINDPINVNERRAAMGLGRLDEAIRNMQERARLENHTPPDDHNNFKLQFEQWAKKVGWRK